MSDYLERFMEFVPKQEDGCWEWTGSRLKGQMDYGTFWLNGGPKRAHCVAYELFVGPIPDGLSVLHSCDNPPCVNPAHLFVGTQGDNMRDAADKQRMNVNRDRDRKPSTKITESQVAEIIEHHSSGKTGREIARLYDVDPSTISLILRDRGFRRWSKRKTERQPS